MPAPLIGITGRRRAAEVLGTPSAMPDAPVDVYFADFAKRVREAGGSPVFLALGVDPTDIVGRLDGVLLAGGEDIEPVHYGADPAPTLGAIDPVRDEYELELVRLAIDRSLPMLGVCRGQQLINVALGGSLIQHVEGHSQDAHRAERTHEVSFVDGTKHQALYGSGMRVNSFHHQVIDRLGDGVVAAALDPDGLVEAIDLPGAPAMAVQWHPEMLDDDPIFGWLVKEASRAAH